MNEKILYNDLIISTVLINSVFIPIARNEDVFLGTDSGIFLSDDGGVHFTYFMNGLSATKVYCFEEFVGKVFAGTDNGLFILNGNKWQFYGISDKHIYSLKAINGELYVGSSDTLFKIDGSGTIEKIGKFDFRIHQIFTFKNLILSATTAGLVRLDNFKKVFDMPVLSTATTEIALYAGTHVGVKKSFDGKNFTDTALTDKIVRAAAVSDEKILFFGTDSGLYMSEDCGKSFTERLKNAHIFSLLFDASHKDTLFVGTWGRGLIRYKFKSLP